MEADENRREALYATVLGLQACGNGYAGWGETWRRDQFRYMAKSTSA